MSDTITYQYVVPSSLAKTDGFDELFLAKYSEVQKKESPPLGVGCAYAI